MEDSRRTTGPEANISSVAIEATTNPEVGVVEVKMKKARPNSPSMREGREDAVAIPTEVATEKIEAEEVTVVIIVLEAMEPTEVGETTAAIVEVTSKGGQEIMKNQMMSSLKSNKNSSQTSKKHTVLN